MKLLADQQSNGSFAYPSALNADGYPTGTLPETFFGVALLPSSYRGTWRLSWKGQLSLLLSPSQTPNSGFTIVADPNRSASLGSTTMTITATQSSYVDFKFNGICDRMQVVFQANFAFTDFSNLALCRTSSPYSLDQAAVDGGVLTEMFNDDFLSNIQALNPRTIRPLNWNDPDFNANLAKFEQRTPVSALSYPNLRWHPTAIATNGALGMKTSNVGDAYSIASYPGMSSDWVDGETIHVQWSSTNLTATPTFTVASRAPKPVVSMYAMAVSVGDLSTNALGTLVYDRTLDKLLFVADGIRGAGVPYEVSVALANKLGRNLWLCIPTHFDLASVKAMAALVRDNLNPGLTAYFEYSNEVWNYAGGFDQTFWAGAVGTALGFPSSDNRHFFGVYGLKVRQFMEAVATTWTANGRSRGTLKCVMAFQAFGDPYATKMYRLEGADLNLALGRTGYAAIGGNYNTFPNRPVDFCDVLSYATYYSGAQCANFDGNYTNSGNGLAAGGPSGWSTGLLGAADAYASGDPTKMNLALAFLDWDIRQGTLNGVPGPQTMLALRQGAYGRGIYPTWEAVAASYDSIRTSPLSKLSIECYEGGMESSFPSVERCSAIGIDPAYGGPNGRIANLLVAYKNNTLFQQLVSDQLNDFMSVAPGNGANHSVSASWFCFGQGSGRQWALFPGDLYSTPFKSYNALPAFSNISTSALSPSSSGNNKKVRR